MTVSPLALSPYARLRNTQKALEGIPARPRARIDTIMAKGRQDRRPFPLLHRRPKRVLGTRKGGSSAAPQNSRSHLEKRGTIGAEGRQDRRMFHMLARSSQTRFSNTKSGLQGVSPGNSRLHLDKATRSGQRVAKIGACFVCCAVAPKPRLRTRTGASRAFPPELAFASRKKRHDLAGAKIGARFAS